MQQKYSANNKRIAKNTMLLYVRMLFIMVIQLFTSRIVLNTLGVVDYGIYNVVGGVVTMFAFLNMAMINATQRYITYELGTGNLEKLKSVFTTSVQIHAIISVIIVILGETIGLWFLYEKMVIPDNRFFAALWVFHLSVLTMTIQIMSVPYNSAIVAHEKMGIFAVISVVEVILKLLVVYLLYITPYDRLVFYAIFIALTQLFIRFLYTFYCKRYFEETHLIKSFDKPLMKEMGGFAGWNVVGGIAGTLSTTGLNMLLNVFFGPVVNAARAIAVQIEAAIIQFSTNFQLAADPQITKLYAQKNMYEMHKLLFRASKFTFILLITLSLPIIIGAKEILKIWLDTVPPYTEAFTRLILCAVIIESIARPFMTAANATGQIKQYQIVVGGFKMLILPAAYIVLLSGTSPISVFIVYLIINIVLFVVRLYLVKSMIKFSLGDYFIQVICRCLVVTVISFIPTYFVYNMINDHAHATLGLFVVCIFSVIMTTLASYFGGLTPKERVIIKEKIQRFYKK